MTVLSKIFLICSATGLVAGGVVYYCDVTTNPAWTVLMPLGAVFFGVFLINFMLEKEMAAFDAEQSKKMELARAARQRPVSTGKSNVPGAML